MNEQPERIPDEKVEIVFHQGKRLGPCFGEHSFSFFSGVPPDHFNCRSTTSSFYRDAVSKIEEEIGGSIEDQIEALIREAFFK